MCIMKLAELTTVLHEFKQFVQFWLQHLRQKSVVLVVQRRLQGWHTQQTVLVVQHVLLLLQGLLENNGVKQMLSELEVVDL